MEIFLGMLTIVYLSMVDGQPAGCSMTGTDLLECDFSTWSPPFSASDFGSMPCAFTFTNVVGTFSANTFGDLTMCTNANSKTIVFECSGASLTLENGAFTGDLSAITSLTFDSCNFESGTLADNALSPLTGVTTLQISSSSAGTKLSITDNTLTGMAAITSITTAFVAVGTIPGNFFSPVTSVTTISMKGCSITSIESGAFEGLTSLTLLDLANNQITTLSDGILNPLRSLTNIGLAGNQWDCTCGLDWFDAWASATGVTLDSSPLQCVTPASYTGVNLAAAMYALNCYTTTTTTTVAPSTSEDWTSVPNILTYVAVFLALVSVVGVAVLVIKSFRHSSENSATSYNSATSNNKSIVTNKSKTTTTDKKTTHKTAVEPLKQQKTNNYVGIGYNNEAYEKTESRFSF